jgi:hypothetical protein
VLDCGDYGCGAKFGVAVGQRLGGRCPMSSAAESRIEAHEGASWASRAVSESLACGGRILIIQEMA